MNHENILRISKEIDLISKVKVVRVFGNNGNTPRVEIQGAYGDWVAKQFQDELTRAEGHMLDLVGEKKHKLLIALEAELKGEICPQPEPDPDAYLQPLTAAFGPHKGLNADWAVMSWLVVGNLVDGVWITDDENDETVSLITRKDDGSGDPALVTICQGTVAQVLPIALSIATQVQHG